MKLASLPKFFLKKRGVRVSDYGLQIEKTSFKDKYWPNFKKIKLFTLNSIIMWALYTMSKFWDFIQIQYLLTWNKITADTNLAFLQLPPLPWPKPKWPRAKRFMTGVKGGGGCFFVKKKSQSVIRKFFKNLPKKVGVRPTSYYVRPKYHFHTPYIARAIICIKTFKN